MPKAMKEKKPLPLVDFEPLLHAGLSVRQIHVLHYLQQGFLLNEVADVLGISEGNVKYHLGRVGKKLKARRLPELLARAIITTYLLSEKHGPGGLPLM